MSHYNVYKVHLTFFVTTFSEESAMKQAVMAMDTANRAIRDATWFGETSDIIVPTNLELSAIQVTEADLQAAQAYDSNKPFAELSEIVREQIENSGKEE